MLSYRSHINDFAQWNKLSRLILVQENIAITIVLPVEQINKRRFWSEIRRRGFLGNNGSSAYLRLKSILLIRTPFSSFARHPHLPKTESGPRASVPKVCRVPRAQDGGSLYLETRADDELPQRIRRRFENDYEPVSAWRWRSSKIVPQTSFDVVTDKIRTKTLQRRSSSVCSPANIKHSNAKHFTRLHFRFLALNILSASLIAFIFRWHWLPLGIKRHQAWWHMSDAWYKAPTWAHKGNTLTCRLRFSWKFQNCKIHVRKNTQA